MVILFTVLLAWAGAGLLAACGCYAWFQRHYPTLAEESRHEDTVAAFQLALAGPISLIVITMRGMFKYGLLWPGRRP